jgi:putative endonuclease
MPYYVYIVYTQGSDIYYKGFTTDPKKRLDEHNAGLSRYTSHDGPWIIVYLEEFQSKTEALKREKAIKRYNHNYIKVLITSSSNKIKFFQMD